MSKRTLHGKKPETTLTDTVVASALVRFGRKSGGVVVRQNSIDNNKVVFIDPLKR